MQKIDKIIEDINYDSITDWHYASEHIKLPERIIEKYADKISWPLISEYQTLSEDFIKKFEDQVDWFNIYISQKLSMDFLYQQFKATHNDSLEHLNYITTCQDLTIDFLEKIIPELNENELEIFWHNISLYQVLSEDFLNIYFDKIDWYFFIVGNKKINLNNFSETFKNRLERLGILNEKVCSN